MAVDWFTFLAQIVNFLILAAVLQKFLYRPIIQAMERREKTISDRQQAAEQKCQLAREEIEKYQQTRAARAGSFETKSVRTDAGSRTNCYTPSGDIRSI